MILSNFCRIPLSLLFIVPSLAPQISYKCTTSTTPTRAARSDYRSESMKVILIYKYWINLPRKLNFQLPPSTLQITFCMTCSDI